MMQRTRQIVQNTVIATAAVLVAFILLEIGARLLPSPFTGPVNEAEVCAEGLGWRGKPYFTTTVDTEGYVQDLRLNSLGMHDEEHPFPKTPGVRRILILGDSFVQAVQVKEGETAHAVLEQLLNDGDRSDGFEVISGGVGGWGTGQQLLYYRTEGRLFQPDLVLLMFYMGNDVKDNLPGRGITVDGHNCYAAYFAMCQSKLDPEPWRYAPGVAPAIGQCRPGHKTITGFLGWLHQSSRLYGQLEPLFAPNQAQASMLDFYIGRNETFDYAFALTVNLVDELHRQVERDGARFGVVLISPLSLVEFSLMDAAEREELYRQLPVMRRAEEIKPPNQKLTGLFSAQGIPVLDLLPPFASYIDQTSELPYFEGDKHWNAAGNRLAGESIYHWLTATDQLTRNELP